MSDRCGVIDKDGIIFSLLTRLDESEKEVRLLKEQLVSKNSLNSSKPPSTEMAPPKRTKSLRKSTDRKPGGQPGHRGNNLKMVSSPDVIDRRIPDYCNRCGTDLSDIPEKMLGRRQLIDIPPIVPVITEQQIYARTCTCGHTREEQLSDVSNE